MPEIQILYTGPVVTLEFARETKLSRYFTGRPCKHGHIAQRLVCNKTCVTCIYKWQENNREYCLRRARDWWAAHPDYRPACENDPAYLKRHRAKTKEWREKNCQRVLEKSKEWNLKNPEKVELSARASGARRRQAQGNHTGEDIQRLLTIQKGKCAICCRAIKGKYHVDHINPIAKGGNNSVRNLQITHPTCNIKKGARDPIEHMQSLGFLL